MICYLQSIQAHLSRAKMLAVASLIFNPIFVAAVSAADEGRPVDLGPVFRDVRAKVHLNASLVDALKAKGVVREGEYGYLISEQNVALADREVIQKENYFRQLVFDEIAKHTASTREQVAETFFKMANGRGSR
jgi:hypothetical protein